MLPEHAVIFYADDVVCVLGVVISQVLQNLQLDLSLVLKSLFVPNNFYSHDFAGLVVHAPKCLPETALAQKVDHFEAISDVVLQDHIIIALVIIKPKVVLVERGALDLLGVQAQKVNLFVVQDFALLVVSQLVHKVLQGLRSADRKLNLNNLLVLLSDALISLQLQLLQLPSFVLYRLDVLFLGIIRSHFLKTVGWLFKIII